VPIDVSLETPVPALVDVASEPVPADAVEPPIGGESELVPAVAVSSGALLTSFDVSEPAADDDVSEPSPAEVESEPTPAVLCRSSFALVSEERELDTEPASPSTPPVPANGPLNVPAPAAVESDPPPAVAARSR